MTQEVYFLASGQYELSVNHAYLPDMIKQINKLKKKDTIITNCSPLDKKKGQDTDLSDWLGMIRKRE